MRCRIRPESDVVLVALVGSWSLLANIERCEDILQRSLVASIVTLWCVMCICCLYLPCVACGFNESEIGPLGIDD
jgi:hypothetical protein